MDDSLEKAEIDGKTEHSEYLVDQAEAMHIMEFKQNVQKSQHQAILEATRKIFDHAFTQPTKANINGNRIKCGACGSRLFDKHKRFIDLTGVSEEIKEQLKVIPVDVLFGIIKQPIEINCRHRSRGKYCNTINEVCL